MAWNHIVALVLAVVALWFFLTAWELFKNMEQKIAADVKELAEQFGPKQDDWRMSYGVRSGGIKELVWSGLALSVFAAGFLLL